MQEQAPGSQSHVNPLVRDLLSAGGGGKVLAVGGFLGPAAEGRVRIYADLRLGTYVELAESDVVRIVDAEMPSDPSAVYFRRDAEITYVQTATMRANEALAAAAAAPITAPGGCGCGGARAAARQQGGGGPGGGGPIIDLCEWSCTENLRLCQAGSGTLGQFWCYLNYSLCRLGCMGPISV
jgi:hypothetical protein